MMLQVEFTSLSRQYTGPLQLYVTVRVFVFRFPYRVISIVIFSPVVNTPADIRRKPEEGASSVLHW